MLRALKSVGVPACERCVLVGLKDPLVRILEEVVFVALNSLHIVLWVNDTQISPAGCFHIISANGFLPYDKILQGLLYVAKEPLHLLSTIQNLAQGVLPADLVVLLPIGPNRFFSVVDSLQVGIPVVQIRKGSKENVTLVSVIATDAFHLVQEKCLVEGQDVLL